MPILQVLNFKFSFISQKMLWTTVAVLSYIQQDITYFILHLRLYSFLCDTVFWSLLLSDQTIFSDFFLYKIFRLIFNLLRSGTGIFGFRDALKWQSWEGTGRRCLCEWGQMFCKGWEAKESAEFLNPSGFNAPCWLQNTNTVMCVLDSLALCRPFSFSLLNIQPTYLKIDEFSEETTSENVKGNLELM